MPTINSLSSLLCTAEHSIFVEVQETLICYACMPLSLDKKRNLSVCAVAIHDSSMQRCHDETAFIDFLTIQAQGRRGTSRQQRSSCTFPVQVCRELNDLVDTLNFEGFVWLGKICTLVMAAPVFSFVHERRNAICAVTACFVDEVMLIDTYTVDARFRHDLFLLWALTHFHLFTEVAERDVGTTAQCLACAFSRVRDLLHRTILSCKEHAAEGA